MVHAFLCCIATSSLFLAFSLSSLAEAVAASVSLQAPEGSTQAQLQSVSLNIAQVQSVRANVLCVLTDHLKEHAAVSSR